MSDVCLILEGTYPYIVGGVSSCAHQLIEKTPQIDYTLFYIGTKRSQRGNVKYKLPKNIESIHEVFLFDDDMVQNHEPSSLNLTPNEIEILEKSILFSKRGEIEELYYTFFDKENRKFSPDKLFFAREVWDILIRMYEKKFSQANAPSFIDFFYNWRFSNLPLFKILMSTIPKAQVYHSLCTGYAGLIGTIAKITHRGSFILTEHGIYTNERKIEISQSEWIHQDTKDIIARKKVSFFEDLWLSKFYRLGYLSYQYSDRITTLFGGNKEKQILLGAPSEKIDLIANGINEKNLKDNILPDEVYKKKKKITLALVGRIVPIKDIKTFIKAIPYINKNYNDFEVLILGPTDEDKSYFEECQMLTKLLGLDNIIMFPGKVNLKHYYPSIDIMILSSISEGQPLVVLEAFAFSIPVVTTDVGSCRELIYGYEKDDQLIGQAGEVVAFGESDKLARKILNLIEDEELRNQYGRNAYRRFSKYYREEFSISKYKKIYDQYIME